MLGYDSTVQSGKDQSTFFLKSNSVLVGIVIIMIDVIENAGSTTAMPQFVFRIPLRIKIH